MGHESRVTLADVAERAGVSVSTASLAFSGSGPVSEATRERVHAAAAALGYGGPDPRARSLRRGRSGIVGVVLEERVRSAFLDPVKIQMLDGITDGIAPLDAGLLLLTETIESSVGLDSAPVDAVVLIGCSPRLEESVDRLRRRGIPTVAIEGTPAPDIVTVGIDNRDATRRGAQHLRDLGHTRVQVVALPADPERTRGRFDADFAGSPLADTMTERLAGAREVFPGITGWYGRASSIEEGLEGGRRLLGDVDPDDRPTAIIAQSDLLAAGVIRAAEELGIRVPEDLSVLGFDGIRPDGLETDLTTLVQPSIEKGRAAGAAVVRMLAGEQPPNVDFTSVLHVGATTAPPGSPVE
ncbi:LacI family DNA-binding transcriptional regulator [Agromyces seonyuensis]|uniref:LacI family DNA-binding transcriptional regulator n=1 Tax=Agromyces seonyuensis TaxID=2662446 RepID=A0A6I4P1H4_9MICO|nr:LacI family DNA-binding transcriptional regulator [Agromyces seonyuensis]MWC00407.1 LacI family DNA-binding transcriptional regulator [Agromyces seonyuensis]